MTEGKSYAAAGAVFGAGALLVLGAVLGLFLMAGAGDAVMGFHGFLFVAFCTAGVFWLIARHYGAGASAAEGELATTME